MECKVQCEQSHCLDVWLFKSIKSVRAWHFVSKYPSLTTSNSNPKGCQLVWNFFVSGHGKGEVDGVGALLKREVKKEQIKHVGKKIHNAIEVVAYLKVEANKYHVFHPKARQHINKFFHENQGGKS
jgi:hypothetical protein